MSKLTNPAQEAIRFYAKQLRLPTFANYEQVLRQLEPGDGYDQFLLELMKTELNQRQEAGQKRRIKRARFPYSKTLDDFEYERLQHVSKALIFELATCEYINNRQNITMIGNSGSGKTHLSIGLGLKACYLGFNVRFFTAMNLANELAEAVAAHRLASLEKALAKVEL